MTAALAIISAGAAVTGCGSGPAARPFKLSSAQGFANSIADQMAAGSRSANTPGNPLRYRTIEYSTAVVNAGLPGAFTAFVTVSRTVTVYSSSAASIHTAGQHPLTFTTPSDRERWVAAGSPALMPSDTGKMLALAPGQFSFVLQGAHLTYRQASDLPETPDAFSAQILSYLRPHPPATLLLKQLGYLIAVAPLRAAARSAAWHVVASLPGLHLCGTGTDLSGRRGEGLCVDAEGEETEILVNKSTGSVLAIEERLQRPSPMYPNVSGGSLIQSITFIES